MPCHAIAVATASFAVVSRLHPNRHPLGEGQLPLNAPSRSIESLEVVLARKAIFISKPTSYVNGYRLLVAASVDHHGFPGKHLRRGLCAFARAAQIRPIDIGPQHFAADPSAGLTLDPDAQIGPELLIDRAGFPKVADGCAAANGEALPIFDREAVQVGEQSIHAETLPVGNLFVNTSRLFTYR